MPDILCRIVCLILLQNGAAAAINDTDYYFPDYEDEEHKPVEVLRFSNSTKVTAHPVVETRFEQKDVDETHFFAISKSVEYFVKFEVPEYLTEKYNSEPQKHIFQIDAEAPGASERFPVDVTVRQFGRMIAFQLPSVEKKEGELVHSSTRRAFDLCPLDHIDSENSTVTVSISSDSLTDVEVSIRVRVKGRGIEWSHTQDDNGQSFTSYTKINPTNTKIRFFDTSLLDTDSIIVKVQTRPGSDCLCSLISIQQPECPFHDDIGSAKRFGVWSSMLDQGTVILHPWEYPHGFIIVLVASAHEDLCGTRRCSAENGNLTDPIKKVRISVGSNGSDSDYALATMAVISLYLAIIVLTLTFSFLVNFKYKMSDFEHVKELIVKKIEEIDLPNIDLASIELPKFGGRRISQGKTLTDGLRLAGDNIDKMSEVIVGEIDVDANGPVGNHIEEKIGEHDGVQLREKNGKAKRNPLDRESIEFIDSAEAFNELGGSESPGRLAIMLASVEEIQEEGDAEVDGQTTTEEARRRRMKTYLFVSDLSTKLNDPTKTKSVYQKSQLYLGVLFLVSLFYSLPVLQMVFSFSYEQGVTGNQDICYYNDLCRKPLGLIRDFNHVFSNLGYCVFGLLFMSIVLFKKLKYQKFLTENTNIEKEDYGVPTQYGLYFAMGLALFMEGVMSSCYHVCPTNVTFQFDTTFMYLIAVLMFMKLYQTRHSDVSGNAIGVFFGLGVALFLETLSIYYSGPLFWIFFCIVYMIVIVVVSVHAFNIGVVKYDYKILFVVIKILAKEIKNLFAKEEEPSVEAPRKAKSRIVCLIAIAVINMILCLFFGISGTPGASNYLLAIFFLNLALYGGYYCAMKVIRGEKIHYVPCIYAGLGLICFLPSLYFFTKKEKMTEASPSESRAMNRECVLLNFFDGHDIWHFLGGAGVFFAFLCILTLDDDVKGKKRNTIHVF